MKVLVASQEDDIASAPVDFGHEVRAQSVLAHPAEQLVVGSHIALRAPFGAGPAAASG
ncbi:hypothetical protein ACFVYT_39170 [Streptomyces sp. NPDC058290]|uniref:hypothetical protein n=1 Tax=Streptomyces sp. NPDC058290 TaxID=3346426 RepID=UPI0036E4D2E0